MRAFFRPGAVLLWLFPGHGFVCLDLPTEAAPAEQEPAAFLRRHPAPADIVELETLSLAEILRALPGTSTEAAIVRRGFPELHANPEIDGAAFFNFYRATYLERDLRSLANVGSLRDFERFLRVCALRSANLLNKADLARADEVIQQLMSPP